MIPVETYVVDEVVEKPPSSYDYSRHNPSYVVEEVEAPRNQAYDILTEEQVSQPGSSRIWRERDGGFAKLSSAYGGQQPYRQY